MNDDYKNGFTRDDMLQKILCNINKINVYTLEKREMILKAQKEKEMSLLNIFFDTNEFLVLQSYIEIYFGMSELLKFKEEFTKIIIQEFHKDFCDNDIFFDYYENESFIGIVAKLQMQGSPLINIALIDIFKKQVILLDNEMELEIRNNIEILNEQLDEIYNEEEELRLAEKNPLYLADGNPVEIFKISTNKNKYKKQIKDNLQKNNAERTSILTEISNYKAQLEEMNLFLTQISAYQTNLMDKLLRQYNICPASSNKLITNENIETEKITYF